MVSIDDDACLKSGTSKCKERRSRFRIIVESVKKIRSNVQQVGLKKVADAKAKKTEANESDFGWLKNISPFRQSHFDHFCGIYALVNCLRLAI